MEFRTMPRVYPEMAMWGAEAGLWTFVISRDGDDPYLASVKNAGQKPFQGQRHDLGSFDTFSAAAEECERWLKANQL